MRVCLATKFYPPLGIGGIARQREALALGLGELGHDVHVVTRGKGDGTDRRGNVTVHSVASEGKDRAYSSTAPAVNDLLTHSQAVAERIREIHRSLGVDMVDAPLWGLEGFVSLVTLPLPQVAWLQTSLSLIVGLEKRAPTEAEAAIMALERETLARADGLLGDSQFMLRELETRLGAGPGLPLRAAVPLGLPDIGSGAAPQPLDEEGFEVLVVGRLEYRKGTDLLFDILPPLLKRDPKLRVRFVGPDNSRHDGFLERTGETYPEHFWRHNHRLRRRVSFDGALPEDELQAAYRRAHAVLVPSRYESFGLVFLEAMRAGKPVVAWALDAAKEVFPGGEASGALLVPEDGHGGFPEAILRLAVDRRFALELGQRGRRHFLSNYSHLQMAEKTLDFYRKILGSRKPRKRSGPRRVYQIMEGLDAGDAVSAITIANRGLLKEMGEGGVILGLGSHPSLSHLVQPARKLDLEADVAVIYHYWGYSHLEHLIRHFRGPKAIHYHNITPPMYFAKGTPARRSTEDGYSQLARIASEFDLLVGDSLFNIDEFRRFLARPMAAVSLPPMVDPEEVTARPYDESLLSRLREQRGVRFLFVGRIARNKRQDRLMQAFDHFCRFVNQDAWLYLVGSDSISPDYRRELEDLRIRLPSGDRIHFASKVPDEALYAYYRAADVFLCASEHEGFCLPLAEAMVFGVPVVALDAAAVGETLGGEGILVQSWDTARVAELVSRLGTDGDLRARVVAGQRRGLERFSRDRVKEGLRAIVGYLRDRQVRSPIFLINPA